MDEIVRALGPLNWRQGIAPYSDIITRCRILSAEDKAGFSKAYGIMV